MKQMPHLRNKKNQTSRSWSSNLIISPLQLLSIAALLAGCAIETKRGDDIQFANQQTASSQAPTEVAAAAPVANTAENVPTQNVDTTLQYPTQTISEPTIVLKDQHGNIVHSKLNPPAPAAQSVTAAEKSHSAETAKSTSHAPKSEPIAAIIAPAAHNSHAHARMAGPVPSDQSLVWLKHGNARFRKGFLRKDGQSMKDIARLSKGQKPHAIVVSCSDSRVPPEVVFDQKLGEVFVVRTAGQSLDSSAIASIEYAVEHLGSNLIVVMGHESCGAVKATLSTIKSPTDLGSPYLNQLAAGIRPRLSNISERTPASEGLVMEGWENTRGAARELLLKSEIIRRAIESGDVKMTSALYHLGSGEVEWSSK